MVIRGQNIIEDCQCRHADSSGALGAWLKEVSQAQWAMMQDVKERFPIKAINARRVVFKIKGNSYRIVAVVDFRCSIVVVRFAGTHAEYDKINAETI